MNKLSNLKSLLAKQGLYVEAFAIQNLIKSAQSLDGVVGLHDERDLIQRDTRERQKYPDEASVIGDQDAWIKSIQMLGDSIVLIPFDYDKLSLDELKGIGEVFGEKIGDDSSWASLAAKFQLIAAKGGTSSGGNAGSIEVFKRIFPEVWSRISGKLSQKNLKESDVVFVLYNQDYVPGNFQHFEKTPFYLAHDLGHSIFDEAGHSDVNYEFRKIIDDFIANFCDFYDNEYESLCWAIGSQHNHFLQQIFNSRSGGDDSYMDVFAEVTAGTFQVDIPDEMEFNDQFFIFDKERSDEANAMVNKLKEDLESVVKKGFLSNYKGKIIIQDVV